MRVFTTLNLAFLLGHPILAGLSYAIIVVLYGQFKLDVFCREGTELSTLYASTQYYSDIFFLLHLILLKAHLQNIFLTVVSDNRVRLSLLWDIQHIVCQL
jgi:hypothetical protein